MASGYLVAIVYDGRTAVGMAREAAFDLLLDIGLPGIDGVSVLRELRNRRERLPVILTFAREEPSGHGADDFLLKPFSLADLLAVVRKAIPRATPADPAPRAGATHQTRGLIPGLVLAATRAGKPSGRP